MTQESQKEDIKFKKMKYLTTAGIFMEFITFGCAATFYPTVLVDLKNRYNTDIKSVSNIFIIMQIGGLIGAITGGQLFNRVLKRQYGVLLTLIGIAASLFLTPYCPSLLLLFLNGGLLGFCFGAFSTAQMVWMLEMWQSKAGPFVQAQHFCFALGSNIPTFLVKSFLSNANSNYITDQATFTSPESEFKKPLSQPSDLRIPFIMAGSLAVFNVIYELFLITFYRYQNPHLENLAKSVKDANSVGRSSKCYRYKLILTSCIFMGFNIGMENSSKHFIPTLVQYGDLKLSEVDGAVVLTGLTGAITVGRAIGILINIKVPPHVILVFNLVFVASGNAILLLWGNKSYEMLWVGCITLGLGFSTMFASYYTFIAQYLVMTDPIVSLVMVSLAIVETPFVLIVGMYIEENPLVITYTNALSLIVCSSAFMAVFLSTKWRSQLLK